MKGCLLAQAADSDYEEADNLFTEPVGPLDLESDPKTTQENGHIFPESQGVDITTYGESNLVAEPQKVRKRERQQGIVRFPGYLFNSSPIDVSPLSLGSTCFPFPS